MTIEEEIKEQKRIFLKFAQMFKKRGNFTLYGVCRRLAKVCDMMKEKMKHGKNDKGWV